MKPKYSPMMQEIVDKAEIEAVSQFFTNNPDVRFCKIQHKRTAPNHVMIIVSEDKERQQ